MISCLSNWSSLFSSESKEKLSSTALFVPKFLPELIRWGNSTVDWGYTRLYAVTFLQWAKIETILTNEIELLKYYLEELSSSVSESVKSILE